MAGGERGGVTQGGAEQDFRSSGSVEPDGEQDSDVSGSLASDGEEQDGASRGVTAEQDSGASGSAGRGTAGLDSAEAASSTASTAKKPRLLPFGPRPAKSDPVAQPTEAEAKLAAPEAEQSSTDATPTNAADQQSADAKTAKTEAAEAVKADPKPTTATPAEKPPADADTAQRAATATAAPKTGAVALNASDSTPEDQAATSNTPEVEPPADADTPDAETESPSTSGAEAATSGTGSEPKAETATSSDQKTAPAAKESANPARAGAGSTTKASRKKNRRTTAAAGSAAAATSAVNRTSAARSESTDAAAPDKPDKPAAFEAEPAPKAATPEVAGKDGVGRTRIIGPVSGAPGFGTPSRPAWQPMTVRAPSSGARGVTVFGTTLTRRQTVIAVAVLVAVLLAMVFLVPRAFGDDSDQAGNDGRKAGGAPVASTTKKPSAAPSSAPAAAAPEPTTAKPSTSKPPAAGGVPKGWYLYKGDGYSVPVPNGASVRAQGSEVYFTKNNRLLIIDHSEQPKSDPVADWEAQEAERRGTKYRNYDQIRLEGLDYHGKAADWEFTYTTASGNPQRAVKRGFITTPGKQAYSISWYTSPDDWAAGQKDLQIIYQGFKPTR